MSRRRVVMTVDRLVIAGLPEGAPGRIAAQIRDGLSAALAGLEAPPGIAGDAVTLPNLTVTLPAGTAPGRVGAAVAEALSGALATAAAQAGPGREPRRPAAAAPDPRPPEPGRGTTARPPAEPMAPALSPTPDTRTGTDRTGGSGGGS